VNLKSASLLALLLSLSPVAAVAQESAKATPDAAKPVPVTIDSYVRAEIDRHFKQRVEQGALGRFHVERGPTPVDRQPVVRMNRDTPYSTAIFDLTHPVTIEMPGTNGRYQSLVIINEDH